MSVDESIPSMIAGSVGFFGSIDDFSATLSPSSAPGDFTPPSVIATKASSMSYGEPTIFMAVRPKPRDKVPGGMGISVILHDASKTTSHLLYLNKRELGWVRNAKKRWPYKVRKD